MTVPNVKKNGTGSPVWAEMGNAEIIAESEYISQFQLACELSRPLRTEAVPEVLRGLILSGSPGGTSENSPAFQRREKLHLS